MSLLLQECVIICELLDLPQLFGNLAVQNGNFLFILDFIRVDFVANFFLPTVETCMLRFDFVRFL